MVCPDDPAATDAMVATLRGTFPAARVLARASDRLHAIRLALTADASIRQTAGAGIEAGRAAPDPLDMVAEEAAAATGRLRADRAARLARRIADAEDAMVSER